MTSRKRSPHEFIFKEELGHGSYSTVYKALDKKDLKKPYAIKVCSKRHIIKEAKVKYVTIEKNTLNLLARGNHPGIVKLYYTFHDEENLYFVLDYASGGELLSLLHKMGTFTDSWAKHFAAQLVDTLEFMHARGVIHRDLKPENVLLSKEGILMITDFGAAATQNNFSDKDITRSNANEGIPKDDVPSSGDKTECSSFVGTAEYVSPELLLYNKCSFGSDIWALGCMVYQFIQGFPPFRGENELKTFEKIVSLDYSWNPERQTNFGTINIQVVNLVRRMLTIDTTQRATIDQIKRDPWFANVDWGDKKKLWRGIWQIQNQITPTNAYISPSNMHTNVSHQNILQNRQLHVIDTPLRNIPVTKQKRKKPAKEFNTTSSIVEWRKKLGIASSSTHNSTQSISNIVVDSFKPELPTNKVIITKEIPVGNVSINQVGANLDSQSPIPTSMKLQNQPSNKELNRTPQTIHPIPAINSLNSPTLPNPNPNPIPPHQDLKGKINHSNEPAIVSASQSNFVNPAHIGHNSAVREIAETKKRDQQRNISNSNMNLNYTNSLEEVPQMNDGGLSNGVQDENRSRQSSTSNVDASQSTMRIACDMPNGDSKLKNQSSQVEREETIKKPLKITPGLEILKQDFVYVKTISYDAAGPDMAINSYKTINDDLITSLVAKHKSSLRPINIFPQLLVLYKDGSLAYKEVNTESRKGEKALNPMVNLGDVNLSMYDFEFDESLRRGFLILEKYKYKLWFISLPSYSLLATFPRELTTRLLINNNEKWIDSFFRTRKIIENGFDIDKKIEGLDIKEKKETPAGKPKDELISPTTEKNGSLPPKKADSIKSKKSISSSLNSSTPPVLKKKQATDVKEKPLSKESMNSSTTKTKKPIKPKLRQPPHINTGHSSLVNTTNSGRKRSVSSTPSTPQSPVPNMKVPPRPGSVSHGSPIQYSPSAFSPKPGANSEKIHVSSSRYEVIQSIKNNGNLIDRNQASSGASAAFRSLQKR